MFTGSGLAQPRNERPRDDIEFDFFEEPDTRETEEDGPVAAAQPAGPAADRPHPLLRLIGLISFAILIVLLLVVWINGCREDQRKDAYRDYVEKVGDYATQSQRLGRRLNTLLTTVGRRGGGRRERALRPGDAAGSDREQGARTRSTRPAARAARAPARYVRLADERALKGMAEAFPGHGPSKNANAAGAQARPPDAALRRERRHLGGPVQGADQERAGHPRHHGGQRPVVRLPPQAPTSRRPRR